MESLRSIFLQRTWQSRFMRLSMLLGGVVVICGNLLVISAPDRQGAYADPYFLGSQFLFGAYLLLTASADALHDGRRRTAVTLRVLAAGTTLGSAVFLLMSELVSLGVFVLVGVVGLVLIYAAYRANREV